MIFTFFFTAIVKDDPFFWCWLPRDEAIDIDCVDAGCKCGRGRLVLRKQVDLVLEGKLYVAAADLAGVNK